MTPPSPLLDELSWRGLLYQQTEVAAYRNNVDGLKLGPTFDTNYMFRVSKR